MASISVVIPLYNGEAWIGGTLEAVLAQTHPADQILVIDDGSTDGGSEVVRRYGAVELMNNPNKGANPARAWGLEQATGDYVALLDQDDRYAPQHLERLSAILDMYPDCPVAVGNNTIYRFGNDPEFADWPDQVETLDQWEYFPFLTVASPSGALFRRAALDRSGGWPTHLEGVADMLTFFRVSVRSPVMRTTACTWSRGEHEESYSAKLRGPGHTVRYMEKIKKAAEEAMKARLEHYPDQADLLMDRLNKFLCIHQVLQALDDQDRTAVHDSVNAFELAYATAQERDCWLACSGLAWMVSLAGRKQADGQLVASYLLRHWPASAEVTGRVVSERLALMVGRSLDWDYFCGAPLSFSRGKGLILMVCKKCCKKAMRYFSSLLRSRR